MRFWMSRKLQAQGPILLHALLGHGVHGALGGVVHGHALLHVHAPAAHRDDKAACLKVAVGLGHRVVVDLPLGGEAPQARQLLARFEVAGANEMRQAVAQLHPQRQIRRLIDDEDGLIADGCRRLGRLGASYGPREVPRERHRFGSALHRRIWHQLVQRSLMHPTDDNGPTKT